MLFTEAPTPEWSSVMRGPEADTDRHGLLAQQVACRLLSCDCAYMLPCPGYTEAQGGGENLCCLLMASHEELPDAES